MRKQIMTVLIVLLLLTLALYFIPWTSSVAFRSTCVEVDRQGNVLSDEGEIVLEGTYYHYLFQRDTFQLTRLELPGVDVISTVETSNGAPTIMNPPRGYDFIWIPCGFRCTDPSGKTNETEMKFSTIFTHPDFPYLVFEYSGNPTAKYFVTTNADAPTPVEMLKEFCLYKEIQTN